jgi:hypothetical protein
MATVLAPETGEGIRRLLAHVLAGVAGGTGAKWRRLIGPMEKLPTWRNTRFHWRTAARGTAAEREVIGKAVDIVRAQHSYIVG